jgi:hypothetical protein
MKRSSASLHVSGDARMNRMCQAWARVLAEWGPGAATTGLSSNESLTSLP